MSEHNTQNSHNRSKDQYERNKGTKVKKEFDMEDPLVDTTEIKKETSDFLKKNQKMLMVLGLFIIGAIAGYFLYKSFVQEPNNEKSINSLATAQQYFGADSFNLALNGDGQNDGFLKVISKYGNTKAGNLAQYYAGMSYLNTNKPAEAIKHLEKFKGKGTEFEYIAYGALGDAYWDQGNTGKALDNYNKAIKTDNNFTTPRYLMHAAMLQMSLNKNKEAIENLQQIKLKYPMSMEARDVEKYLGLLGDLTVN